jgi:hypothetical protein
MQFFVADPDQGFGAILTKDPGSGIEKLKIGSGINIPDPQHCLAHWRILEKTLDMRGPYVGCFS